MVRCTLLASYSIVSKVERRYKIPNPLSTLTLNSLESESEFAHTHTVWEDVGLSPHFPDLSQSFSRPSLWEGKLDTARAWSCLLWLRHRQPSIERVGKNTRIVWERVWDKQSTIYITNFRLLCSRIGDSGEQSRDTAPADTEQFSIQVGGESVVSVNIFPTRNTIC